MKPAELLIITPGHDEYRLLADSLSGLDFDNFRVKVLESGPGLLNTALTTADYLARITSEREKPLMIIGAGLCGSLSLKLSAGEALLSPSAVLGDWLMESDHARSYGPYGLAEYRARPTDFGEELAVSSQAQVAAELIKRLAAKGVQSGRLLSSDAYLTGLSAKLERGRILGCLAADSESGALALAAERQGLAWLNLRIVADTIDPQMKARPRPDLDLLETLSLKLLVVLSTLDGLPKSSGCGGCGQNCGFRLK